MEQEIHYLARQPILDRNQSIFGYEFFARQGSALDKAQIYDPVLASASVLVRIFSSLGMEQALGDKKGFVNFPAEFLEDETLALFPKDRLVLEVMPGETPDPAFVERCKGLQANGWTLALDNFVPTAANLILLPLVSYVKFNVADTPADQLGAFASALRKFPVKLVAMRVETQDLADQCAALDMEYFQGYYFAHPSVIEDRNPNTSKLTVIRLLNQLMGEADIQKLEDAISRDAPLSYKLLRYLNSAGMGQVQGITSIRRALVALGRQQLYRWLTLILFAGTTDVAPSALVTTAAVRGRMAELFGKELQDTGQRERLDQLFIVGMFSLLEALLNMPLERILHDLHLPEEVLAALTRREGVYGAILNLVESIETGDVDIVNQVSQELGISPATISKVYLEAMAWAASL